MIKDISWNEMGGNFIYGESGLVCPEYAIDAYTVQIRDFYLASFILYNNIQYLDIPLSKAIDFNKTQIKLTNVILDATKYMTS